MKLRLLEVLVWLQFEKSPPLPATNPQMGRFWTLVAGTLCWELAIALWISGAIRPLSALW